MERENFEQLLSDWLDEPQREDLRAQLDAAAAGSDELRTLRASWERLDGLVRDARDISRLVYWPRIRERFLAGIADDHAELVEVDRVLASLPGVERRVDWAKLHPRICAAVQPTIDDALASLPPIDSRVDWNRLKTRIRDGVSASMVVMQVRRRRWRIGSSVAGALAAAAAVALFFWWPFGRSPATAPPSAPTNFAAGGVQRIGVQGQSHGDSATGVARVVVFREPDVAIDALPEVSVASVDKAADDSDVFLMIEPRAVAAVTSHEVLGF